MQTVRFAFALTGALLLATSAAGAQASRVATIQVQDPPAGMCRVLLDGVPADRQPAPTDCASARAHASAHSHVIYGPRADGSGRRTDDPRYDPRNGQTRDPRYDPRNGQTRDPRYDPRYDPRDRRTDPRSDPRNERASERWDRKSDKEHAKAERKRNKEWEKARKHGDRDDDDDENEHRDRRGHDDR